MQSILGWILFEDSPYSVSTMNQWECHCHSRREQLQLNNDHAEISWKLQMLTYLTKKVLGGGSNIIKDLRLGRVSCITWVEPIGFISVFIRKIWHTEKLECFVPSQPIFPSINQYFRNLQYEDSLYSKTLKKLRIPETFPKKLKG